MAAGIVGFDFSFFGPVAGYTNADNLNDEANPAFGVFPAPRSLSDFLCKCLFPLNVRF